MTFISPPLVKNNRHCTAYGAESLLGRFSLVLAAVSLTRLDTKKPLGVAEGRRGAGFAVYLFDGTSSNTRA
jgi:hypothetical protein